ncbi:hypothetical protein QWI28_15565 [Citrobacter freundii]|nr:hypothetical protein [Citrobacter freundii]
MSMTLILMVICLIPGRWIKLTPDFPSSHTRAIAARTAFSAFSFIARQGRFSRSESHVKNCFHRLG